MTWGRNKGLRSPSRARGCIRDKWRDGGAAKQRVAKPPLWWNTQQQASLLKM